MPPAEKRKRKKPPKPRKIVDEIAIVRSASGLNGQIREEVWVNAEGDVVKYNLAYINHHLCHSDNGRVLGYDNAHGDHERHVMGKAGESKFTTYEQKSRTFYAEVAAWRKRS